MQRITLREVRDALNKLSDADLDQDAAVFVTLHQEFHPVLCVKRVSEFTPDQRTYMKVSDGDPLILSSEYAVCYSNRAWRKET